MADKKVDATTGEVQLNDIISEQVELLKENKWISKIPITPDMDAGKVIYTIHCKPVYNYQSVEFDWEIRSDNPQADLVAMEDLYSKMLEMLVRVSQNAPQKDVSKPVAPVEEPASEKQKEILRNFHIDFKPDITKKQAHALIKKSMDQEIF